MSYTIRMVAVAMLAMLVGCGQGKDAADSTANSASNAMESTKDAANASADAMKDGAATMGDASNEAMESAANSAGDMADDAGAATDEAMDDASDDAAGEPWTPRPARCRTPKTPFPKNRAADVRARSAARVRRRLSRRMVPVGSRFV